MKYAAIFLKTVIAFILLKYKILPSGDQSECINSYDSFLLTVKPDAAVKFEEL